MPKQYTLPNGLEIVIEECIECGTHFGMSATHWQYVHDNKKTFYCPNGHYMAYVESEADRARKQMKKEADELRAILELKARQARKLAEGICPICNKPIKGITSHMAKKHPNFS